MTRLSKAVSAGKHANADRGNDLYETPREAVIALLDVVEIPAVVWEPACGPGSIVRTLRGSGRTVIATDLVDYGCPGSVAGRDFLMEQTVPEGVRGIITNPPYKLAGEFVAHALDLFDGDVFMLLRLAFLESEKRRPILDGGDLVGVLPFRNRLPMMHRAGWQGPKASSATPYAWFWFHRGWQRPAWIRRISWEARVGRDARP